ncbi:MAG: aldo/keto reductase [Pseudomonadota bacterium]
MTFKTIDWAGTSVPALGMGCWAIGGPFSMAGRAVGWGAADDATSKAAIAAAYDAGLRIFDTAQAYGTGHSETLLGEVLAGKPDVRIVTKVGIGTDPDTRSLTGWETDPAALERSLDASLFRLKRDQIDLALLHPNELSVEEAEPVFDWLDHERAKGRVSAFGWSTDETQKAQAYANRDGFGAVELAANLFFRPQALLDTLHEDALVPLIRSPLGMGLLGGRITKDTRFPADDVRAKDDHWLKLFDEGRPNPAFLDKINEVRALLTAEGRSLAQGAIGWLWALDPRAIPVPGLRTPKQVADLAGALEYGPLPAALFDEIETLMDRPGADQTRPG